MSDAHKPHSGLVIDLALGLRQYADAVDADRGMRSGMTACMRDAARKMDSLEEQYEDLLDRYNEHVAGWAWVPIKDHNELVEQLEAADIWRQNFETGAQENQRLEEQLEAVQRASDNAHHALHGATVRAERLEEQLEAAQGLQRSADAALEAVGGRLEHMTAERDDLLARLEKLAAWYGHDLQAATGRNFVSNPAFSAELVPGGPPVELPSPGLYSITSSLPRSAPVSSARRAGAESFPASRQDA